MIEKPVHAIYGLEGSVIASNKKKEEEPEEPKDLIDIREVESPKKDEIYLLDDFYLEGSRMRTVGTYLENGELASYIFLSDEEGRLIRPLEPEEEMTCITYRYMQFLKLPITI